MKISGLDGKKKWGVDILRVFSPTTGRRKMRENTVTGLRLSGRAEERERQKTRRRVETGPQDERALKNEK
jgi:hypothetical protein